MAELDKESSEIAKEKRKQRAKDRLNSLNGGDITRGLNSGMKDHNLVSDTYSTQKAKEKVAAKSKAKSESSKNSTTKFTSSKTKKSIPVKVEAFEEDSTHETKSKKKSKKQIGSVVVDESALENISTVTTDKRSRRNKVIISILAVAIVLIWIAVLVMLFVKPKEEKHNCFIHLSGNGANVCEVLFNGQKISSWKAPTGIGQGSNYKFDLDLKINAEGTYYVKFRVEVKNNGQVIEDVIEISPPTYKMEDGDGDTWYVYNAVDGNSKIELLNSITFLMDWKNPVLSNLNDSNAEINFYIEVYLN